MKEHIAEIWRPYWETFKAHSLVAVPMRSHGRIIGVLIATRDETPDAYTEGEQHLLQDLAHRAGLAIENGRLYQAERQARSLAQQSASRTERLQSVTAALGQALTPLQVAEVIVVQGAAALGGQAGQVLRLSDDGTMLEAIHAFGYPPDYAARYSRFALSEPMPSASVVRSGQPLWIASQAEFFERYPELARHRPAGRYEALVITPLRFECRILGTLVISFDTVQLFSEEDRGLVAALSDLCAQALERARLYTEAQSLNARLEESVAARTAELEESREQLRRLSARLEDVRELERARVAREVHDEIGQQLSGLKMDAFWLQAHLGADQPRLIEKAQAMSSLLNKTIAAVRQISTDLRPGLLDDFGLLAAVEWQVHDFQQRHATLARLQSSVDEVLLPPETATAVFRVFQDALSNVARHAEATEVTVRIDAGPGCVVLQVHDNGHGVNLPNIEQAGGLGLMSMRERMKRLGGEFSLESSPGHGTTARIKIPI
jgi:signal transduction histidine kinase